MVPVAEQWLSRFIQRTGGFCRVGKLDYVHLTIQITAGSCRLSTEYGVCCTVNANSPLPLI